jgi:hypothetical protein
VDIEFIPLHHLALLLLILAQKQLNILLSLVGVEEENQIAVAVVVEPGELKLQQSLQ